jgi:histidyl-tRNA synthetase
MSVSIPTGVFDILPACPKEPWRESHLWNFVEKTIRDHAASYSCQEVRTPIFERAELFSRTVGDTSDIVEKEMYVFKDRGERLMALRPEGTASVMRAFIEKQLHTMGWLHKLFYIGPMFRYERPQAGRFRQHHQFGVEFIGNPYPEQDAEVIEMIYSLCSKLGLHHLKVTLNSLGEAEARFKFKTALKDFLEPRRELLSEESQNRLQRNPLRILDSKKPEDIEIVASAPSMLDFLNEESKAHFQRVLDILDHLKIPCEVNNRLVRGLDYYNHTVFEITSGKLGAQNSVAGGGRYDGLLKSLGGPDLPSIGFGCGIERLLQVLLYQQTKVPEKPTPDLFLIPLGEKALFFCFELSKTLRGKGKNCWLDLSRKKLKSSMQQADLLGAKYSCVIGDNEIQEGKVQIKDMSTGSSKTVSIDSIIEF